MKCSLVPIPLAEKVSTETRKNLSSYAIGGLVPVRDYP